MKTKAKKKPVKRLNWDKIAEETRQRCNKLTDSERKERVDLAFQIIYGTHAATPVRRD
jgi:hypothetical protein